MKMVFQPNRIFQSGLFIFALIVAIEATNTSELVSRGTYLLAPSAKTVASQTTDIAQIRQLSVYRNKMEILTRFLNDVIPTLGIALVEDSIENEVNSSAAVNNSRQESFTAYSEKSNILLVRLDKVKELMENESILSQQNSVSNKNNTETTSNSIHKLQLNLNSSVDGVFPFNVTFQNYTNLAITANSTGPELTSKLNVTNMLTGCGGAINNDRSSIVYKQGRRLSEYEECFWLVQAKRNSASNFVLSIRDAQFLTTATTHLSVGYFKDYNYTSQQDFIWKKFEPLVFHMEIPAAVVFIHFVASPEPDVVSFNRGFYLDLEAKYIQNITSKYIFTSTFLTGSSGSFQYPLNGSLYENLERSAIVVQPTMPNSKLTMEWWDFENDARYDSLTIWFYDSDYKWKIKDRLYSSRSGSYPKEFNCSTFRTNPMILTFSSDSTKTFGGYAFSWNH